MATNKPVEVRRHREGTKCVVVEIFSDTSAVAMFTNDIFLRDEYNPGNTVMKTYSTKEDVDGIRRDCEEDITVEIYPGKEAFTHFFA